MGGSLQDSALHAKCKAYYVLERDGLAEEFLPDIQVAGRDLIVKGNLLGKETAVGRYEKRYFLSHTEMERTLLENP